MAKRKRPRSKCPNQLSDAELIEKYLATNKVQELDPMTCDNPVPNKFEGANIKRAMRQSILCNRLFKPEPPEKLWIKLDIILIRKKHVVTHKRNLADELISE